MASKYPVHKDFRKIPAVNQSFSRVPVAALNLIIKATRYFQFKPRPGVEVRDLDILARKNMVKVKIFRPTKNPENKKRPCLVYFHGGAFALTYVGPHLNSVNDVADRLDAVVVFVEYTLTNQAPFPAGFNDCYDATVWAAEHADDLGIDAQRLFVGGDSAGGAKSS